MEIAPNFTDNDWKSLDLSREGDWLRAIEAFRLRIEERFLKPVRAILSFSRSGFAILALDSLLVETLQQSIQGVEETPQGSGAAYFKAFLKRPAFRGAFDDESAELFRTAIRNALFRPGAEPAGWLRVWAGHFGATASAISPVDENGVLRIPWPTTTLEGAPAGVDVILATATKAEAMCPSAEDIADAWLDQNKGYERYFFENVRHGIRTPEDSLIWRRIEQRRPHWLGSDAYAEAIAILRGEAAQRV